MAQTTRIYLTHGYRGKDMDKGKVFYPKGEHDFPTPIAERLIGSGQAIRVGSTGTLQGFVGTPAQVAVTVEQVFARVQDLSDEQILDLARLNNLVIPDATTRARAIAALVEVAISPNAVLLLDLPEGEAKHTRLAADEADRQRMLHEQGKLEHAPSNPAPQAAPLVNALTGIPYADDPNFDPAVMARVRSGELAWEDRAAEKRYLIALASESNLALDDSQSKAEMIAALNTQKQTK